MDIQDTVLENWALYEGRFNSALSKREENKLVGVASDVDRLFSVMSDGRMERESSAIREQWKYGIMLHWLSEPLTIEQVHAVVEWKRIPLRHDFTRWELFTSLGWEPGLEYGEWACKMTGVKRKTWQSWVNATRVYLMGEAGQAVVERAGLTLTEFVERVPMDKALRAAGTISKGRQLTDDQVSGIVDVDVSSRELAKRLGMGAGEAAARAAIKPQVESLEERSFTHNGNGAPVIAAVFDDITRELRIEGWTGTERINMKLAHFPITGHNIGDALIGEMVALAARRVDELKVDLERGLTADGVLVSLGEINNADYQF